MLKIARISPSKEWPFKDILTFLSNEVSSLKKEFRKATENSDFVKIQMMISRAKQCSDDFVEIETMISLANQCSGLFGNQSCHSMQGDLVKRLALLKERCKEIASSSTQTA